jgi:hypothetical protein
MSSQYLPKTLTFPLQFHSNDQGRLEKQGKCTLWSCITLSSFLSCPYVSLTNSDRQCVLIQKKKQWIRILTLTIGLFPTRKRSSYSPLIVSSTSLHLTTSNDLGSFWKTKSCCFVFALFWLSVRSMSYA